MPAAARYAPMAEGADDDDAQLARLNTAAVAAMIDEELEAGFGSDELDRLRSQAPRTAQERRRSDLMLSVEVQNAVAPPLGVAVGEDTNAVLCPEYRAVALFGRLPRWALALLQLPAAVYLVAIVKRNCFPSSAEVEQAYAAASSEAWLAVMVHNLGLVAGCGLFAAMLSGLHEVSRPGGQLELLGMGNVKISARQKRNLGRRYVASCTLGLLFCLYGVSIILTPVVDPDRTAHPDGLMPGRGWDAESVAAYASVGVAFITTISPVISLSHFSLLLGAALASDAVDEVIQRIEELSPTDARWEEEVEQASVKLAEETMEWLSAGWASGVALFFLSPLLPCVGMVVMFAVFRHAAFFVWACILAVLPLLVCYPLAVTSSKCDDLLSALNTKSLRYVAYTWSTLDDEATSRSHRDTHLRLQALQQGLRQLNYDQVRRISFFVGDL